MPNGFCTDLLYQVGEIAGENAPGRKMNVAGMLAMLLCCQNSSVSPVNAPFDRGHTRGMNITYRRRSLVSDVQSEDNCDINIQPGKLEWQIPQLLHRQLSFHIADDLVRQYCVDASNMRRLGTPPTAVMQEVWEIIVDTANTLLAAINQALVTVQATEFGVNTTTGSSTGKFININRNGNDFALDDGVVEMMQDLLENRFCGTPCIVGGGIYSAFNQARALACCNAAGLNLGQTGIPNFYWDQDTQTIWGANSIGVFAPGSVKFISRNKFVGSFAGDRGASFFTTLPMPVEEFGCADECLRDLVFDLQLKYYDCPTEIEGGEIIERGWQGILSKDFHLWTQPDNAYQAGDPLFGTNGTLKYFVSNNSYAGGAYAYPGA